MAAEENSMSVPHVILSAKDANILAGEASRLARGLRVESTDKAKRPRLQPIPLNLNGAPKKCCRDK